MAARCTCSTNTCSTKTRSCFPCSTNTCSTKTRSCFSFLFLALYCAIVLCLCFFSISSTTPWGKCFSCRSKSKTLLCLLEYFLLAIFETTAKNSVLERCGPGPHLQYEKIRSKSKLRYFGEKLAEYPYGIVPVLESVDLFAFSLTLTLSHPTPRRDQRPQEDFHP